ncbi:Gfo/Idh/MocA family oxidoreductase [Marinomonas sp. 15G1-11]|uniref:Gfo/Idh/MocA family oxidoreductase n=1 Tax=Marinomonas phaeophyticola TaxID=3004091 RepID=A0ABT4JNW7_9GAMM|nr:Gfo/Idh/MocA family oxidoreductase [Marinomonas sp. 15G1-11]MCZ2720067.1 Gfo/Idh/MocA family oxidoreductase [Marinomonas sp. 15G1-11]
MKTIRWGIIGTGTVARNFAHDFAYAKAGELTAIASRNKETADQFAADFNVDLAYIDYFSLINSDQVDVIYIAVPHHLHYKIAKACILANKSILCEKPFTINHEQSSELYDLAKERNVFAMEAMWTRFNPVIEQVYDWIEDGELGQLNSIQASFGFVGPSDPEHRLLNKSLAGGALLDLGIYPVFLAQLFFGKPDFIQNQAVIGDTDVDIFNQILLGWEQGQLAILESSLISHSPNKAVLSGSKGYIEIDGPWFMSKSCRLIDVDNNERSIEFDFPGMGYQFEIDEVNRCLEEGLLQSPNFSWQDSLQLISTLDEVRDDIGLYYDGEEMPMDEHDIHDHHHEHHHHKH